MGWILAAFGDNRGKAIDRYTSAAADRDVAILEAYESGGYTLQAIGNHFGLHYSRVNRT